MIIKNCLFAASGLSLVFGLAPARAQDSAAPARPHILGIAQVAFYVHDIGTSRKFYHDFLGYDEAFTLTNPDGSLRAALFKIDDHQTVELIPEKAPATDRLNHIALETDDVEAMRLYLKSRGVEVPEHTTKGLVTTAYFTAVDPDGHTLEFVQYAPESGLARDTGKHLPATRLSLHMSHAGVVILHLDAALKFYRDILGCTEIWQGSGNGKTLNWMNMRVPDGTDWVEFMLYKQTPTLSHLGVSHHFCLLVPDVTKAGEILSGRPLPIGGMFTAQFIVGTDHKRQIHAYDPDGSRIEIMEPVTVDGNPSPWSHAPPPN